MTIRPKLNFINYKIGWVSVIDYIKDRINDHNFIFKLATLLPPIARYSENKVGKSEVTLPFQPTHTKSIQR